MDSFPDARITNAFFANNALTIAMNDGRIVIYPCQQMDWLMNATQAQQQDFDVESDGYGVWWHELDDGVALHHIFSPKPIYQSAATV